MVEEYTDDIMLVRFAGSDLARLPVRAVSLTLMLVGFVLLPEGWRQLHDAKVAIWLAKPEEQYS